MPTYVNPYSPQTPIGAGLQNVAIALFAGQQGAEKRQKEAATAGMYDAHRSLYEENAKKAAVERQIAERLLGARSPDSIDLLRASEAGLPVHTIRGIDAAHRGEANLADYAPEMLQAHRRATLAVQPAYADKTISPVDIAKALDNLRHVDDRNAIITGQNANPTRTAQGYYATSGKAPFDNMGGTGTFNLLNGVQELNALGKAKVNSEGALARERGAKADQTEKETRAGVKFDAPPVIVDDPETGTRYTSAHSAVTSGMRPGARPADRAPQLKAVVDKDGVTRWVAATDAVGQEAGRPGGGGTGQPRRITGTDRALMENALGNFLSEMNVGAVDDATKNALLLQAEKEWQDGAEGHTSAVKAALDKVAPGGLETPFQWRSVVPFTNSQARPKGGAVPAAPAAAAAAPKPAQKGGEQLPAAARAKLKEGVQTTFGNGSVWMLTDGVPVRVK